jgi:hypothetical protein
MTFAAVHQYLSVIGDCYGGRERWQFGLRVTDTPASSNQDVALALAPVIEAWWRGTGAFASPNNLSPHPTHRLTEFKCARVGMDGTYPAGQVAYSHFFLPPIAGDGVDAFLPPQLTLCVTLRTAIPRGLASHGRIYLPLSARYTVSSADGLMGDAGRDGMANSVKTLINQINAHTAVGTVQVMSKGKGVKVEDPVRKRYDWTYPDPGVSADVTHVEVGRAVDTQRRRRRQLAESKELLAL